MSQKRKRFTLMLRPIRVHIINDETLIFVRRHFSNKMSKYLENHEIYYSIKDSHDKSKCQITVSTGNVLFQQSEINADISKNLIS